MSPGSGLLRAALVTAAAGLLVAGCGPGPNLVPRTTTGSSGWTTVVLVDQPLRPALMTGIRAYVSSGRSRVVSAAGTPDQVVTSVKDGAVVDAVVLPAGPALDRVRDELVAPAQPIGRSGTTVYWVAPVTARGLAFARFLLSGPGLAVLRAQGLGG